MEFLGGMSSMSLKLQMLVQMPLKSVFLRLLLPRLRALVATILRALRDQRGSSLRLHLRLCWRSNSQVGMAVGGMCLMKLMLPSPSQAMLLCSCGLPGRSPAASPNWLTLSCKEGFWEKRGGKSGYAAWGAGMGRVDEVNAVLATAEQD